MVATIGVGDRPAGVVVAAVPVDTTPPACALTAMRAGPPTQIDVTVQDPGSGLASVVVTQSDNANTVVPPFAVGSTAPVVVTATKIIQGQPARVALRVTDVAGNVTNCDPVLVALDRATGKPKRVTVPDLPQVEHFITVTNGTPGITTLRIEVNGTALKPLHLDDGQTTTLNVASAMAPGSANTIILTPTGKPGGNATVLIHD